MKSSFLLGTISAILHRFVQSAMFTKWYRCFRSKPYLFQLSSPFQVLLYMLANCFLRGLNTKTILNAHKMANFKEAEDHHRLKKHDLPQTSQPASHLAELYFSTFVKLENTIYRKKQGFQNTEWIARLRYMLVYRFVIDYRCIGV